MDHGSVAIIRFYEDICAQLQAISIYHFLVFLVWIPLGKHMEGLPLAKLQAYFPENLYSLLVLLQDSLIMHYDDFIGPENSSVKSSKLRGFSKITVSYTGLSMNIFCTGNKSPVQWGFFNNSAGNLLPALKFLGGLYNYYNFVITFSLMKSQWYVEEWHFTDW